MVKSDQASESGAGASDDILKFVGLRLKEARQKNKLTQKEIAEKAGLKQSYVFELETGRTNITLRTLAKMAEVLEVGVRDLLPEGKSNPASSAAVAMLYGALEKISAILQERELEAARRQVLDAELLTELRSFAALKVSLERAAQPLQDLVPEHAPQSKKG